MSEPRDFRNLFTNPSHHIPENVPIEINNKITFLFDTIQILEKYKNDEYLLKPFKDEIIKKGDIVILTIIPKDLTLIRGYNKIMNVDFEKIFGNEFILLGKNKDDINNYLDSQLSDDEEYEKINRKVITRNYKVEGLLIPTTIHERFITIRPLFFQDKIGKIFSQKNKKSKILKVKSDYFDIFINCEVNTCPKLFVYSNTKKNNKLKGGKTKKTVNRKYTKKTKKNEKLNYSQDTFQ